MFSLSEKFETRKQLLGEILVEQSVVESKDIDAAVGVQQTDGGFLGECLVKMGFVQERDVVAALVIQNEFPYIAVDKYEIESDVTKLISEKTARDKHIMPLDRVGSILSVVMADPLDSVTREELRIMTNCQITPFIATKEEIDHAIELGYGEDS